MTHHFSTRALAAALVAALVTAPVKAEKVVVYREGQLVNPTDVAGVLGKTRSIRMLDDAQTAPARFAPGAPVAVAKNPARQSATTSADRVDADAGASALSLPVRFAFDSADILPAARAQLDALAEGIKLLAPKSIVTVEGHTDAVGSDAYNLELSERRAKGKVVITI